MVQCATVCFLLLFLKCTHGVMKEYFFCRKDMSERQLSLEERTNLIATAVEYIQSADDKKMTKKPRSLHANGQIWELMWSEDLVGIDIKERMPMKKRSLHVLVYSVDDERLEWYTYPNMTRMSAVQKKKTHSTSDIRFNPYTSDVYFLNRFDGTCYIRPIRKFSAASSHRPMCAASLVPEAEAIQIRFVRKATIIMSTDSIYKFSSNSRRERIASVENPRLLYADTKQVFVPFY